MAQKPKKVFSGKGLEAPKGAFDLGQWGGKKNKKGGKKIFPF